MFKNSRLGTLGPVGIRTRGLPRSCSFVALGVARRTIYQADLRAPNFRKFDVAELRSDTRQTEGLPCHHYVVSRCARYYLLNFLVTYWPSKPKNYLKKIFSLGMKHLSFLKKGVSRQIYGPPTGCVELLKFSI